MDKILIHGLTLFAYHGVNSEEKETGQRFILDIELTCDLSAPCQSDRVEDTVSYAAAVKTARRIFCAEKNDLIERAAERVAQGLLNEYPGVFSVDVTVKKPDAPIQSTEFDYMAVRIVRSR